MHTMNPTQSKGQQDVEHTKLA